MSHHSSSCCSLGTHQLFAALLIMAGVGCGDANFSSEGYVPASPGTEDVQAPQALTWSWSCEDATKGSSLAPSAASPQALIGPGPHQLSANGSASAKVAVTGKICPASSTRDIVFIVDVSGSMDRNDPVVNGSCGRLNAIRAVASQLKSRTGIRYGLVTFSGVVQFQSAALVTSVDTLLASAAAGAALCYIDQGTTGGTNYTAALTAATNLIGNVGQGSVASREIFFVSDGQPDNAIDSRSNGTAQAKALHQAGVTIATVMLGPDSIGSNYLEATIASKSPANGQPLHTDAANAEQLSVKLADLSVNDMTDGMFSYKTKSQAQDGMSLEDSSNDWIDTPLKDLRVGSDFATPVFEVEGLADGARLDVRYWYKDRRGAKFEASGTIVWNAEEDAQQ